MNLCLFIGNLTKDPETAKAGEYTKCTFNIAVQRRRPNKDGVREADFVPIIAWRQLGDSCSKYLRKGSKVAVTAHLAVERYTDAEGKSRLSFQFIADNVDFLPSGARTNDSQSQIPEQNAQNTGFVEVNDEELPF